MATTYRDDLFRTSKSIKEKNLYSFIKDKNAKIDPIKKK